MPSGREDRGDDSGAVLVGREELETHRLGTLAAGTAEPDVAVERGLEPLVQQEPKRNVEPADEGDRRREGAVQLGLAGTRLAPSRSRSAAKSRGRREPPPDRDEPEPGGVISAFCEPEATTSSPQASVSRGRRRGWRRRRRRRARPTASPLLPSAWTSATTPVDVSECVRTLPWRRRSRRARAGSSGRGVSPHSYSAPGRQPSASASYPQRSPNTPAETTTTRSPASRGSRLPTPSPPCPTGEEKDVAAVRKTGPAGRDIRRTASDSRAHGGDDRLGEDGEHLGWDGCRTRRQEVPLLRHSDGG